MDTALVCHEGLLVWGYLQAEDVTQVFLGDLAQRHCEVELGHLERSPLTMPFESGFSLNHARQFYNCRLTSCGRYQQHNHI